MPALCRAFRRPQRCHLLLAAAGRRRRRGGPADDRSHRPRLTTLDDTAAFVSALDLVITGCTSVTHLSGALGQRTRVRRDVDPHWVWLLDRNDSPRYPSATLYQQPWFGQCEPMLDAVAREWRALMRGPAGAVSEHAPLAAAFAFATILSMRFAAQTHVPLLTPSARDTQTGSITIGHPWLPPAPPVRSPRPGIPGTDKGSPETAGRPAAAATPDTNTRPAPRACSSRTHCRSVDSGRCARTWKTGSSQADEKCRGHGSANDAMIASPRCSRPSGRFTAVRQAR